MIREKAGISFIKFSRHHEMVFLKMGLLHYHIQDPHVPWKVLFLGMERLKGAHQIVEDYTISETTLEQVFLAFARAQKQGN
uniref:Uncharacterized protein n=1 Tax=Timema poppense TaxID=170557 RepID=A0A7R9DXE9_TIMPO|nr:unnamed protein product [Timema poppensis]